MEKLIKIKPTPKQHEAWEALKSYHNIFFGGGAGGGKSWWLCESRLVNCYLYPGYKSFIAREELKRLMASTYLTWCKVCQYHNIPKEEWTLNGQYAYIEFKNGSRIDLLDVKFLPSDPFYERFGSLEYSDGAIEECGEIDFRAYDVLKTRIGRHLNKELGIRPTMALTGNPKKNWTYLTFYQPWKNGTLPGDVCFIQALYGDNPHTAAEYEVQLQSISDKSMKERLMLGNWNYENDPNVLIDFATINDMFTNDFVKPGKRRIVADIARYGSDRAIITVWEGLILIDYLAFNISSTVEIQNAIHALKAKYQVPVSQILVDSDGVGGGVQDSLKCQGFINGGKPTNSAYMNLKCECGYKLAELASKIWIKCELPEKEKEAITLELGMLRTYDADKDGKLRIMPKEKIKEYIGRSPDWLDCFIMRMYFELGSSQKKGMDANEISNFLLMP
jgi:phage terminase large subunit